MKIFKPSLPSLPSFRGFRFPKLNAKNIVVFVFILLFCGTAASAGYFFWQYRTLTQRQGSSKEVAEVVKAVGMLMALPNDETPTLATVTDIEKIKSQPFFARAENGDKVLLYLKLGKAIMYRPSVKKIIDITEIKTTQAASASANQNSAVLGTSDEKK